MTLELEYTKVILRKETFDKQVFGDTAFINIFKAHYKAFDALGKYIVIGDSIVSKNHKDITKHYTLENILLQLQIGAFRDFSVVTRFRKSEPSLLVSAVDIAEGLWLTFESSI
jgi:hypothetical protein